MSRGGAASIWLPLALAQLRAQPLRALVTVLALAFGVALFASVWMVNDVALGEFDRATRRLAGEADVIVRGPRAGFDEQLYAQLAADPEVRIASPVLELDVALADRRESLHVLGLDTFRASTLQPALAGHIAGDYLGLFARDAIWLSEPAARLLGVGRDGTFAVQVGAARHTLRVRGVLPPDAAGGASRVGIMDIASAQWLLQRVGTLNRIDLQLVSGARADEFRARIAAALPAGLQLTTPAIEAQRAATLSRAYRVNLSMLALVSLLTGALLLFATQSLSILRRRSALALLRALGVTRGGLQAALVGEGVLFGAVGSAVGVALGYALALLLLALFRGSFGPEDGPAAFGVLRPRPLAFLAFFALGTAIAALGALPPAREAARRAPAHALKAGDAESAVASLRPSLPGVLLLAAGTGLAFLPAIGGIPLFGYAAIAALLFGALLLVPAVTAVLLARLPQSGRAVLDIGLAQVRGSISQLAVSLAAVIVSFSLMVAMAIMVYSFRVSFDHWLQQSLPADVQLRVAQGSDTRFLDEPAQRALAAVPGIATMDLRRSSQLLYAGVTASVALLARDFTPDNRPGTLTLVGAQVDASRDLPRVWVSEALLDTQDMRPGARITLPIPGHPTQVMVAGVFRDYGRFGGAIVIDRARYTAITGDSSATEAAMWLESGAELGKVVSALRATLGLNAADAATAGEPFDIRTSAEVRELSMRAFDRAFQATYALEAAAVLIGLVGIACAGASTALARRGEFGMLRHLGMLRRQIVAMLAAEGFAMASLAALYGLVVGGALSVVLVHVVNRQSFNWSIDLALPWPQLAIFAAALLAAATLTNVVSGRAALGSSALRAVREDW